MQYFDYYWKFLFCIDRYYLADNKFINFYINSARFTLSRIIINTKINWEKLLIKHFNYALSIRWQSEKFFTRKNTLLFIFVVLLWFALFCMTTAEQMEPLWESRGRQIDEASLRRGSGKWHSSFYVFLKILLHLWNPCIPREKWQ